jgi:hypothetical protein
MFFVAAFAIAITAHSQTDYLQWEVMSITPKADKLDLFKKGLAAHNKKYHASDPYKVGIASYVTGPKSGSYAWVMGPCTWTQLDSRPVKGEHDLDWDKNVVPHCESFGEVVYWRLDNDINYSAANSSTFTKTRLRNFTILPGQFGRATEQFKKIATVYKQKGYNASYHAYWREGASTGPHLIISIDFAKWAYFDSQSAFVKDFEEIHGAQSWNKFLEESALCIDRAKTYDELIEWVGELGSGN